MPHSLIRRHIIFLFCAGLLPSTVPHLCAYAVPYLHSAALLQNPTLPKVSPCDYSRIGSPLDTLASFQIVLGAKYRACCFLRMLILSRFELSCMTQHSGE